MGGEGGVRWQREREQVRDFRVGRGSAAGNFVSKTPPP